MLMLADIHVWITGTIQSGMFFVMSMSASAAESDVVFKLWSMFLKSMRRKLTHSFLF